MKKIKSMKKYTYKKIEISKIKGGNTSNDTSWLAQEPGGKGLENHVK